jgi:inosine/xanthosine triphosphatase
MKVLVGSRNPAKILAVKQAFSRYWSEILVAGETAESGISEMPLTDEECIIGAINRAKGIKGDADFKVGIEGGAQETMHGMFLFGWAAVYDGKKVSIGCSPRFIMPEELAKKVKAYSDSHQAFDEFTGIRELGRNQGAVGYFTRGEIDRAGFMEMAVIMALTGFLEHDRKL